MAACSFFSRPDDDVFDFSPTPFDAAAPPRRGFPRALGTGGNLEGRRSESFPALFFPRERVFVSIMAFSLFFARSLCVFYTVVTIHDGVRCEEGEEDSIASFSLSWSLSLSVLYVFLLHSGLLSGDGGALHCRLGCDINTDDGICVVSDGCVMSSELYETKGQGPGADLVTMQTIRSSLIYCAVFVIVPRF